MMTMTKASIVAARSSRLPSTRAATSTPKLPGRPSSRIVVAALMGSKAYGDVVVGDNGGDGGKSNNDGGWSGTHR